MKTNDDLTINNALFLLCLSPLLLTAARAIQDSEVRGAEHPSDGPEVKNVCAVAPTVIAITLQAGQHVNNELVPYVFEPGDEIVEEEKDKTRHAVQDGEVIDYFQKGLFRKSKNDRVRVGLLSPDGKWVFIEHATKGQMLDERVVDDPAAYTIQSTDDRAYVRPRHPVKLFRKGKPDGFSQPLPFLYTISLQLPGPLKQGARYTIRFVGVNTSQETVAYTHRPRQTRSIALHAIQTGYRPDDPCKRAYLSFWMGVDGVGRSGSCTHDAGSFELVDNRDNLSYCTGVGHDSQHFNFIVDAQITGQLPDVMVGHIPYGQGNEGNSMSRSSNSWVQQWLLNFGPIKKMIPNWYDWPVNEQYIDFGRYPLHNENCFNATTVPAACYWFYLHSRPKMEGPAR